MAVQRHLVNGIRGAAALSLLLAGGFLSLTGCVESRADQRVLPYDEKLAKRVIVTRKCGTCHRLQARGLSLHGKVGPDLTHQGRRGRSAEWLRRHLVSPLTIPDSEVVAGYEGKQRLMPPLTDLSRAELDALVAFLRDLD